MNSRQQYADLYTQAEAMIRQHSAGVMNDAREAAFAVFQREGFPSRKVERYKYTDIDKIFAPDYGLNLRRLEIPINPYDVFRCDVPNLSTSLYFVVNDQFCSSCLPKVQLPEGVIVDSLAAVAERQPELVGKYYNRLASQPHEGEGITALNTMLAQDGLFVYIPRNTKLDRTLQVVNILRSDVDLMVNRRLLIVLEEGAELSLLFCDHTADDRQFLATQVVEVFLGAGARLGFHALEETNLKNRLVSNTFVRQERSSSLVHNAITLHNGLTRNQLDLTLAEEGAECMLGGFTIEDCNQHVDNNTLITHAAPHCDSRELYKYILNDQATGAFAGRVLVKPEAQQTTSAMTNQNLCGSTEARMYTQPMLEIYADDVKCSHGSTVGQLNDAALFYMQQRGIPLREARLLLQTAFVSEVIDQIPLAPLRDRLHYLVDKRFRGELNRCEGCKLKKS